MLKSLDRITSYFQLMRDKNMMLNTEDLDNQFNDYIDYINNDLRPILNQLVIQKLPGILGYENYYLKNVGDGTTIWAPIDISSFNQIPTQKFAWTKEKKNFILRTSIDKTLHIFKTGINASILITESTSWGKMPHWHKQIDSVNIENNSININNIEKGAIEIKHLNFPLIFDNIQETAWLSSELIPDKVIAGENIADQTIFVDENSDYQTGSGFASYLDSTLIVKLEQLFFNLENTQNYEIEKNSISSRHINKNFSDYNHKLFFNNIMFLDTDNIENESITQNFFSLHAKVRFSNSKSIAQHIIEPRHIKDGTFNWRSIKKTESNRPDRYTFFRGEGFDGVEARFLTPVIPTECLDPIIREKLGI